MIFFIESVGSCIFIVVPTPMLTDNGYSSCGFNDNLLLIVMIPADRRNDVSPVSIFKFILFEFHTGFASLHHRCLAVYPEIGIYNVIAHIQTEE